MVKSYKRDALNVMADVGQLQMAVVVPLVTAVECIPDFQGSYRFDCKT